MHATLNATARMLNGTGGFPCPPSLLFRNLAPPSDQAMSPADHGLFRRRRAANRLKIGGFVCCTGSPGMWGPAATSSAQLAVAEINRRGGILGREIEFQVYDAGGPIDDVLDRAEQAIASDEVDLIMGMHTSAVRVALRGLITRSRLPYIYTPVYEGGERTPGVIAIGETPRWQNRPSIHWLAEAKRASRWYLIGSDYVWPWQSHRAVKRYIKETGGVVVGEEFVPVGEDDHEAQLERIRAAKPDVVLISLIGTDSVTFNRAFADAGLAATTLRFAGCVDETVLLGIGADKTENLFCASGYFPSVGSRAPATISETAIARCSGRSRRRSDRAPSLRMKASACSRLPPTAPARWTFGRCSRRRTTSSIAARVVRSPCVAVTPGCRCILPKPTASTSG
ncbi:urea transport system substrate-binding protein [Bradyrhizobium sp. USDA 3364]